MKRSISHICNRGLRSSVLLHPKTTKCSHCQEKVHAYVMQLSIILQLILCLGVIILILKYSVFIIFLVTIGNIYSVLSYF